MTQSYPVDLEKLRYAHTFESFYFYGLIEVPEDYEHFDKLKRFLSIPEDSPLLYKSLDERFDSLIESTKLRFAVLESRINDDFKKLKWKQDREFEQLRTYGCRPRIIIAKNPKVSFSCGDNQLEARGGGGEIVVVGDSGPQWTTLWGSHGSKPSAFSKWLFKFLFGINLPT